MSVISNNVYILYSSAAPGLVLDIEGENTANGTPCQIWKDELNSFSTFNQQWLISEVPGQQGIFTLRNLRCGTYLDLSDGSNLNGGRIQGYSVATGPYIKNQQWRIIPAGSNYRLQNVAGGTYLDFMGGWTTPGTKVHGWQQAAVPSQEWRLHRVSRAGHEINTMIKNNPHIGTDFKSYLQDGLYIVLRESVRKTIYNGTALRNTKWRNQVFDCDDFAFVAKAEVAKWGNGYLRAEGFAILFGIMFGTSASGGGHAYNWYLNEDLNSIMFFEPQNGQEMVDPGYKGYFGVF